MHTHTSMSWRSKFSETLLLCVTIVFIAHQHIQISKCIGWLWFVAFYIRSIDDIVWSLSSVFSNVLLLNWIHLDFRKFWLLVFASNELCIRGNFSELQFSLTMLSTIFSTKITWWWLRIRSAWNRIFPMENHASDELNFIACKLSYQTRSVLFLRCINESSCSLFSKTKTFWQTNTKRNDIQKVFIFEMNEKWFSCATYLIGGQMQHTRWTTAKFPWKTIFWTKCPFSEMDRRRN